MTIGKPRKKRADFLFHDGEFLPKVITKQKKRKVEKLREQEEWEAYERTDEDSSYEGR